jgi:hypothetical protein
MSCRRCERFRNAISVVVHPTWTGYLRALGPIPLPTGRNVRWRQAFLEILAASGLTGKGGAGFPASIKLAAAHADGTGGIIVVNGMASDPTGDKDKVLLTKSSRLRPRWSPSAGRRLWCARDHHMYPCRTRRYRRHRERHHARAQRISARQVCEVLVRPPPIGSWPERSPLWQIGSKTERVFRYFDPTRGSHCESADFRRWCKTRRRSPTSHSSPAMARNPSSLEERPKSPERASSR